MSRNSCFPSNMIVMHGCLAINVRGSIFKIYFNKMFHFMLPNHLTKNLIFIKLSLQYPKPKTILKKAFRFHVSGMNVTQMMF